MATSKGEQKIIDILHREGIYFEREKQFPDLRGGVYRYDFFLPDRNICLEYNGEQHYVHTKFMHKTISDFKKAQERDRRKVSYCLARGIKLYCIPYWDLEKIENFDDLVKSEYLARTQFHNDDKWREYQNN